jgi:ATP phosphoribosyltransferase
MVPAVPAEAGAMTVPDPLTIALPKGRILDELRPLMAQAGLEPEPAFDDPRHRGLSFATNHPHIRLIRVRSFDVATFVAFGAAQLGVAGNDVLMEFDYPELYAPLDLGIGACRLAVAEPVDLAETDDPRRWSHIRVATKYPHVTRRHFAARGVQAECIKLNANGLREIEHIADVTSRLIVNRAAFKTRPEEIAGWVDRFRNAVHAAAS